MRQLAAERTSGAPTAPTRAGDQASDQASDEGGRLMRAAVLQLLRDSVAMNKRIEELQRLVSIQVARVDELTRHIDRLERRT